MTDVNSAIPRPSFHGYQGGPPREKLTAGGGLSSMNEVRFPYPHDTDPDIFREALPYSEATTGFTATLIEKDYYCSLILQYFFDSDTSLVFKGGTCLSMVYADFYRLSEDLDLIIPVVANTSRDQIRAVIEPVKRIFIEFPTAVPGIASYYPKIWMLNWAQYRDFLILISSEY